ncbi:MAG: N-acetyl-gamma-glutamyl-phosphate reductase [Lachnospiraceae bacterium]|nr:N-acetyl-gamma-glutamyl-phosphate reductase [Lachnospiraceae bacterium]MDO4206156.1 N-acetyl-gamma-glutamyl-phosphate reductase [Lachnospiraceae bacterium]
MKKVFIDGSAGTTGLKVAARLSERKDIAMITLDETVRKDVKARQDAMNQADVVFLCLPDDAAIEAVPLVENENTVIIDTSTAHRVAEGWTYGFAELSGLRKKIQTAKRIANPGCHASGFLSLATPLTENKIIPKEMQLSCFSLTGYSGGGKKMIAEYEAEGRNELLDAPRLYGLTQMHKHLPEMKKIAGLEKDVIFSPIVAPYFAGMEVVIPISPAELSATAAQIKEVYQDYYKTKIVHFNEKADEDGFLSAGAFAGKDDMEISLAGNEERLLLISRFDNLGKGASGAAIQNMNIALGIEESEGLVI